NDILFQPYKLRDLTLPNRIVVSPMAQYSAGTDGVATDWHLVHYGNLSLSGAGLMIMEATAVVPEGRVSPHCLGLWDDAHIDGLRRIVEFAHRPKGGFIGIQLAHAGRKASVAPPWLGADAIPESEGGWPLWGASSEPYPGRDAPIQPNADELEQIAESY